MDAVLKRIAVALVAVLLIASPASAAWHLYLVPVIGTGTQEDPRSPKYLASYACTDYGHQPQMLCAADVDAGTDAALQANSDVTRIPDNLDAQLGAGAVTAVQNALEARNIPAGWVTQALTYRTVLRTLFGMFSLFQRYAAIAQNPNAVIDGATVTLSTQFNQLPLKARQDLQATVASFGLDTSGLTGASTIRQILKAFADQFGQRPFTLGGVAI